MKFSRVDAAVRDAIVPGMSEEPTLKQRDMMRTLYRAHGGDETAVCEAYAKAERLGQVPRASNEYSIPADRYAKALWRDGVSKGWLG